MQNILERCLLALLLACMAWLPTMAENVDKTSAADTSRVFDLDEVIVVSQPKESFRLRRQPLSGSMFSSADMDNLNVRDLRELSSFVPSFVMPAYGSRYTSSMYIRGIGSRINSPAVGMYMDGIPLMNKSQYNAHSYQMDRVDVLRGPQGTLYGINTEGGLVRMYTRNPMKYQGTDIQLGAGTKAYRNLEASHYQKISEQLAFSLAGFYSGQNGFFRNQTTGDRADEYDEAGGKVRIVWQPANRLMLDYIADYQFVRQNGFPYGQLDLEAGLLSDPATNRQGNYRRNMVTTGLNVKYAARGFDLYSTTSYQFLKDDMLMDIDYMPQDFMHMEQGQLQNAVTQELTLKSSRPGIWKWTMGGFFSQQWLKTDAPVYFDDGMNSFLSQTVYNAAYYGMLNAMAARMGMEAAQAMIARAGGVHIDIQLAPIPGMFRTPQTNIGFYHESNIDLTSRLTATLGLRYDYSRVAINYQTSALMHLDERVMGVEVKADVMSSLVNKEHDSYSQLLPKIGLSYRLDNHDSNVYATVAKGYRAGGFNIQMFSDILQTELQGSAQSARADMTIEHDAAAYENIRKTIAYKPEESWNYEFGTHLNLFSNSVQLDFAGFFMQVRNQQLSVMAGNYGFGRMMVNAGKSYSCGIEAALRGHAFDNRLTWGVSYSYTHAAFREYTDSINGEVVDYKDKRVPFVPMHNMSAMADYTFPIHHSLLQSITLGANITAQGKTYWDEANTYSQRIYAVLGAHVCADFGRVKLNVWGRNLTDTRYNTFAFDSSATGEKLYFAQQGNPFQVGIDVRIHL